MYRIIGSDKKEYGAYTAEQIKPFIREGRSNGESPTVVCFALYIGHVVIFCRPTPKSIATAFALLMMGVTQVPNPEILEKREKVFRGWK